MENKIKNTLEQINVPQERRSVMLSSVLQKASRLRYKEKESTFMKNKFKLAIAGVSMAAVIALTAIIIPHPSKAPQTITKAPINSSFSLTAKRGEDGQPAKLSAIENGKEIKTKYSLPEKFFQFNENDELIGSSVIEFMVEDEGISKVVFECQSQILDYQDSRNYFTEDGKATWSQTSIALHAECFADINNPTEEEIATAFAQLQTSEDKYDQSNFNILLWTIYADEFANLPDYAAEEKLLAAKRKVPIDLSQYITDYEIWNDAVKGLPQKETLVLKIINPANNPIPRVSGKRVETRAGEYLMWEPDYNDLGKKSEIDFSQFADEISVSVYYNNGTYDKQIWEIEFDQEGNASMLCKDLQRFNLEVRG
ncbi:MAG: hypothetical protein LBS74_07710 [Oscillospiraceae bacterium]|jgi:hypothetical protein|nr:hypothetical protein [Oscillospiraceae bacterium]